MAIETGIFTVWVVVMGGTRLESFVLHLYLYSERSLRTWNDNLSNLLNPRICIRRTRDGYHCKACVEVMIATTVKTGKM